MYTLLSLGLLSFCFCAILTPQVRNLFKKLNITDTPDSVRKIHIPSIPRVGGIAIAVSYVAALAILAFSPLSGGSWAIVHAWHAVALIPSTLLIFGIGLFG